MERVDLDKKSTARTRGFCPYFCAVDHPICDAKTKNILIGAQIFERAKNYKPTWTKIGRRPIFVLRWNKKNLVNTKL